MMLKKQALILLLSALAWTNLAHALGMGDIELNSSLNQPLDAEIELLQLRGLTAGEILPALASNDAFQRAGVERSFFLSNIRFQVRENEAGNLVIGLNTREPVREPFLNFLVEVNWPGGRLLKEFTLLLDPPVFDTGVVGESLVVDPAATSTGAVTELTTTTTVSGSESQTQSQPAQVEPRQENLGENEYRVQRNDTLWEIALRVEAGSGYSPQQVMLAIQDLNPDAFLNNNINRLKAGSLLNLPDESQIALRTLQEAVNEVRMQNEGQAARPRAVASEAQEVQLTAAESTASALPEGDAGRDPDGYLEVAPGEAEGTSAGGDATAQAEVTRLQNELAIAGELADQFEREKQELESRVAQLEEQITIMQRMLNLQSADAAALQSELADQQASGAEVPEAEGAPSEAVTDVPVASEGEATQAQATADDAQAIQDEAPVEDQSATPAAESDTGTQPDSQAAQQPETAPQAEPEPAAQPEPAPQQEPAPQPQPVQPVSDPGFMGFVREFTAPLTNWIMASVTNMVIAGASAIILLLLPSLIRSRLKKDDSDTELDQPVAAKAAASEKDEHDFGDDLLADFDDDDAAEFETEEAADEASDALMEAEMYMAYQKFEQAEEKLKTAFAEQPERSDIGLKLLEVYSETGNGSAFEELAGRLNLSAEQQRQVADLRSRMPLVSEADDQNYSMEAGADSDLDFGLDEEDEKAPSLDDLEADLRTETGSYDLSEFDAEPESRDAPEKTEASDDLDFSLDIDSLDLEEPEAEAKAPVAQASDDLGDLDFDLETDDSEDTQPKDSDSDLTDLDFTLEDDNADSDLDFNLDDFEVDAETRPPESLDLDELSDADNASLNEQDDTLESLDFSDLDSSDLEEAPEAPRESPADLSDLSLDEDWATEPEEAAPAAEGQEASADAEDNLQDLADALPGEADLEDDEFDFLSGNDEASTKLDLARAYIEMDDKEGARDILEEVAVEGNDEQKRQAKELMDQL
ncbi:MAG: FimV/HubP family polar landmark protein [Saccharospirillum sp.]